ncbi:glycosyltransferase family 4 protein [Selenomonas caprae]|uniref:Glycosyltransferase family 4 protein n=1 Tax=Selenomonas caprae TaxID=2606905 RepID=A0A5D6WHS5_9FIRM|nr:glycosyltransferase family 4 protein [Selenomonas caprae]TYZ26675.1 glycosyltransferase family 4 protein [Selenomonas caprae]
MRIVIVRSTDIAPDPRVEKEAYSLKKAGHDVQVLGWDREENHGFEFMNINAYGQMIKVTRVGIKSIYGGKMKNVFPLLKYQINICKWLWDNKDTYDAIHACDLNTGLASIIMAKLLKKKLVYDIFDYYPEAYDIPEKLKKIVAWIEDRVIYGANAVIICTEQRIEQIKYHGDMQKLYIVHNSPIVKNEVEEKNDGDKIKIVYVGILQRNRYIEELMDIVSKRKDIQLDIAGFGILESQVKKMADENENIFFHGKINYEKTLQLESNADIMTALYKYNKEHHYAAPNKFYEALMLGKPVIMEKNTGVDEWISKYDVGCVIGVNAVDLNSAIDYLINRKNEWIRMSNDLKKLYVEKFSWNIMEKRLVGLYRNI